MKQISIDALNNHLFETIEMLKNNNDPNASQNEKMDIETAKTIANLGKVVVEGYKVKANVLQIISSNDIMGKELAKAAAQGGFIEDAESKMLTK